MKEMTAYLVHAPEDRPYAERLAAALAAELHARIQSAGGEEPEGSDIPALERREGLESMPAVGEIGPMALVLLVLPGRPFKAAESERISAFLGAAGRELRLLPVACDQERARPPEPLSEYVSAAVGDPDDKQTRERVATWLLIQFYLRASSDEKSVFISYRERDGKVAAARLETELAARGYQVFRDERLNADDQKMLAWGSKAQDELAKQIRRHSVLLLVDTPLAYDSEWVKIEVETAHSLLKPIFPVVVLGPGESSESVARGGRFPIPRANQTDVVCGPAALTDATVGQAIDAVFLDRFEAELGTHLTRHNHVMRYMIRSAREQFDQIGFTLDEKDGDRLHLAMSERHQVTPWLQFRLLVRFSPYKALVRQAVRQMRSLLKKNPEYCQYGLLIEPPLSRHFTTPRKDLLEGQGGHLLILQADEIRSVASKLLALESRR